MAPSGFTGAINSPTADTLPFGSMNASYSNSIPERATRFPSEPYGGLTLGFGIRPGLEVVGRLVYDGNLTCSLFEAGCNGRRRDLSVGAKYRLPLELPLGSRVAVGFTDYGGAATFFRSAYAVGTVSAGPVDLSLGYGKKASPAAILGGVFGSAIVHVTDQVQLIAESDSQAKRVGLSVTQPINEKLAVQLGASRKLSGPASQTSKQLTAAVVYYFERQAVNGRFGHNRAAALVDPAPSATQLRENDATSLEEQAKAIVRTLGQQGFSQISVRHSAAGQGHQWFISAEPELIRNRQTMAIGRAFRAWVNHIGGAAASLELDLTYMGVPYQRVSTSRQCILEMFAGRTSCERPEPLSVTTASRQSSANARNLHDGTGQLNFKPQVELGLDLVTTIGTEVGLIDYSIALDAGAQVQLAKGLFWHGNILIPALQSTEFKPQTGVFRALGHPKTQVDQAMLSYMLPLTVGRTRIDTQFSVGAFDKSSRGAQADALWRSNDGLWRVGATLGAYTRGGGVSTSRPAVLSVRRSLVPGKWAVEASAGEYLAGDRGWLIRSQHWFGDIGVHFVGHSSGGGAARLPKTNFAGVEFTLPLSATWSRDFGIASVRAKDRFNWGTKTKVGARDNSILRGYATAPEPRHGIWTDFTDNDRTIGSLDILANRQQIVDAARAK